MFSELFRRAGLAPNSMREQALRAAEQNARLEAEEAAYWARREAALRAVAAAGFQSWTAYQYGGDNPFRYPRILCTSIKNSTEWDGRTWEQGPGDSPLMNAHDVFWKPLPAAIEDGIIDAEFEVLEPKQITSD